MEIRPLAAADGFEGDDALDRVLQPQRLQELALAVGGGGDHGLGVEAPRGFDHFEPGFVEQFARPRPVEDQHRFAAPQRRAPEHFFGARCARLAHEAEVVAGRGAIEGERAAFCQQLERAREGGLARVADDIIGELAAVERLVGLDQRCAGGFPLDRLGLVFGHHGVEVGQRRILAVDRAHGALHLRDELRALLRGNEPRHLQSGAHRASQGIEPRPRRRALDEQRPSRRDLQGGEQAARDRAEVKHIAPRLLQREVRRHLVHLRRLHGEELRVAPRLGLVALNAEIRIHRIIADQRREQIIGPRIDRHQIADLDPPLRPRLAAERSHQRDPARSGDLHVFLMRVEGRDRDAGQRPDVVEVDLARQHVEQRLVGRGLGRLDDQLLLVARRRAEAGLSRVGIAGDAEGILVTRDRGHAGIERRSYGKQLACRFQDLRTHFVLGINPHPVAPHRERGRNLVDELFDPGLAAFGIDDGLGKELCLAGRALGDALFKPHSHGFERACPRLSAPGPVELAQDALEEVVLKHSVEADVRRQLPTRRRRLPFGKGLAEGGVRAVLHKIAHRRMGRRKRIFRADHQLVDHTDIGRSFRGDAAPAEDQVERIAHALGPAPVEQQTRQALGAAIAGEQPQPDFGLAETRGRLGDAVVAGERELHTAAQRHALHRRDAGLTHALDRAEGEVRVVGQHHRFIDRVDLLEHLANVRPRDEGRSALAGEHHRDHILVPRQR